jgi:hypothetical protein
MARFFETPFNDGSPISRKGFAKGIRRLAEAFERMRVYGGSITWDEANHIPTIRCPTSSSATWDGTAPEGFEWETLNVVTDGKIVTREVLTKTSTKADVVTWDSDDARMLLQVKGGTGEDAGKLRIDKGYLVE